MTREDFFARLAICSDREFVQQDIVDGDCAVISKQGHFQLKGRIADNFGINHRSVVVVGSAKLGISIAPKKRFKLFDSESDIDVAIVAPTLFDNFWIAAFEYSEGGAYWKDKRAFFEKVASGWIRPDLMPRSEAYPIRAAWWDFFETTRVVTEFGEVPVRAGLYKDWAFLESYHEKAVSKCRRQE